MEDIQNSSIEQENLEEVTENDKGRINCNPSVGGEELKETFANCWIKNYSESHDDIRFIDDEDSHIALTDQKDKIIELRNVESYLDKELSVTAETIKALFVQFVALQRHTLRRHLKVCKNMIKDLDRLVEFLNEETFPLRSHIEDELKLWKQELEKVYERILSLKTYFLKAVTRADVLDYSIVARTSLFITCLKNSRSILHGNYELTYMYLSDAHKMQKNTIRSLEDVIGQHRVTECLISKIAEALPTTSQLIFNPRSANNSYRTPTPFIRNVITRFNNFLNQRSISAPNLSVIPEENLHLQQTDDDIVASEN